MILISSLGAKQANTTTITAASLRAAAPMLRVHHRARAGAAPTSGTNRSTGSWSRSRSHHDVMATRQHGDELRVMDICGGAFPFPSRPPFTLKAAHIIDHRRPPRPSPTSSHGSSPHVGALCCSSPLYSPSDEKEFNKKGTTGED